MLKRSKTRTPQVQPTRIFIPHMLQCSGGKKLLRRLIIKHALCVEQMHQVGVTVSVVLLSPHYMEYYLGVMQ